MRRNNTKTAFFLKSVLGNIFFAFFCLANIIMMLVGWDFGLFTYFLLFSLVPIAVSEYLYYQGRHPSSNTIIRFLCQTKGSTKFLLVILYLAELSSFFFAGEYLFWIQLHILPHFLGVPVLVELARHPALAPRIKLPHIALRILAIAGYCFFAFLSIIGFAMFASSPPIEVIIVYELFISTPQLVLLMCVLGYFSPWES